MALETQKDSDAAQWWYVEQDQVLGPVSWDELRSLAAESRIIRQTRVWRLGLPGWLEISAVPAIDERLFSQPKVASGPAIARSQEEAKPSRENQDEGVVKKKGFSYGGVWGGIAIAIIVIAVAKPVGKLVGGIIASQYISGQRERGLEEVQLWAARQLQKQLPKKLDDVTTLYSVSALGHTLMYSYRIALDRSEIEGAVFLGAMRNHLLEAVCSQPKMRETMSIGARYSYTYVDKKDLHIGEIRISGTDCARALKK